MGQISVDIRRQPGSVLRGNQRQCRHRVQGKPGYRDSRNVENNIRMRMIHASRAVLREDNPKKFPEPLAPANMRAPHPKMVGLGHDMRQDPPDHLSR